MKLPNKIVLGERSLACYSSVMKALRLLVLPAFLFWAAAALHAADKISFSRIRVLLITGGHGFEQQGFFSLFQTNADVKMIEAEQPAAQAMLKSDKAADYDVIVLYDLWQDISDEAKAAFISRLKEGKGLVVLHHALCSYQKWPEYEKIIGGKYYLDKVTVNGVEQPASSYKHGMHFKIHVADPNHPITRGISDFEIDDETYKDFGVLSDSHPLLTTDEPTSTKTLAWTRDYKGARVVYIQSGHDHTAYENPNYQRLLSQAIRWAAKRD